MQENKNTKIHHYQKCLNKNRIRKKPKYQNTKNANIPDTITKYENTPELFLMHNAEYKYIQNTCKTQIIKYK